MRRVLMISYDFPPSPVGIWRTLKFCRYMPEFGWQPYVLTVKPVRAPRQDSGPLRELPAGTEVRRTGSLDPGRLAYLASQGRTPAKPSAKGPAPKSTNARGRAVMNTLRRWVFVPDDRMLWLPFALAEGRRWVRQQRFDAVYTTSFPHTAHLVGAHLSSFAKLPWLADFRDSWTGNYEFFKPATALHAKLQHALEGRVVRGASRVVSATGPITEDFARRHVAEPADKFVTITNGFDEGDYSEATPQPDREHFTISYVGTLFGDASPRSFFAALRRLLDAEPAREAVLRVRFTGSMIEPYRDMIHQFGLGKIVHVEDYVPHAEALRAMAEADALLLLVPPVKGARIMLTQKVFEYAAARRPILGLVPEGAARDFLTELGEGPILAPDDIDGIVAAVRALMDLHAAQGRIVLPDNPVLEKYRRRNLTATLCAELDAIVRP